MKKGDNKKAGKPVPIKIRLAYASLIFMYGI